MKERRKFLDMNHGVDRTEEEIRRLDKVKSLIIEAERLEADIQAGKETAVGQQAQVMDELRNLAVFKWRGMSASLSERENERHNVRRGTLMHDEDGWYYVYEQTNGERK
jgi:hypothetical protein